jgi:hypothetical protein
MKRAIASGWIWGLSFLLIACGTAPTPSNMAWVAHPAIVVHEAQYFEISVEPKKGEAPYFAYFLLRIKNKSQSTLSIDWNKSRYLYNGKKQGLFVFAGIDPETVRTKSIPEEAIYPNTVYSREIMPHRLISWSPIKEKTAGKNRILPGMIPEGENGVGLVILEPGGKEMGIPLLVQIKKLPVR